MSYQVVESNIYNMIKKKSISLQRTCLYKSDLFANYFITTLRRVAKGLGLRTQTKIRVERILDSFPFAELWSVLKNVKFKNFL